MYVNMLSFLFCWSTRICCFAFKADNVQVSLALRSVLHSFLDVFNYRVVMFDHRKLALSRISSTDKCQENVTFYIAKKLFLQAGQSLPLRARATRLLGRDQKTKGIRKARERPAP